MSIRIITLSVMTAGFMTFPALSSADVWHDTYTNAGPIFYSQHMESNKTRAEVLQEIKQAQQDGSFYYLQRGLPVPEKKNIAGKTREQVQKELQQMTEKERIERQALYGV